MAVANALCERCGPNLARRECVGPNKIAKIPESLFRHARAFDARRGGDTSQVLTGWRQVLCRSETAKKAKRAKDHVEEATST